MSVPPIHHTLHLNLHTLTPLTVGGDKGKALSPYADFIFSDDGRQLRYLHLGKIEQAVKEQDKLEEYVRSIRDGMDNTRSKFGLQHFLTHTLQLNLDQVTRSMVPQHGLRPDSRRNINPTVKNAGQPYLPGSSLKGALRTAMLYDWLVNTDSGKKSLNDTVALLDKMKHLNKWQIEAEKEKIFDESPLLGSFNTAWGPDARFLRVSDSAPLPATALAVYNLGRIRLKPGGKSTIPQVLEAIPPHQELHCSLRVDPWLRDKAANQPLDYLADGNFQTIFQHLGAFARDCIAHELRELYSANNPDFKREIDGLIRFYEGLQKRANDEGAIFLRLGFGKTVTDNCLLLALASNRQTQTAFNAFRAHFHKLRQADKLFPITRTLTPEGMPMGWVEVKKKSP